MLKKILVLIICMLSTICCHIYAQKKPTIDKSRFAISSTSASFSEYGGSRTFAVTADKSWEITKRPASWVSMSQSGKTIKISVYANSSSSSRMTSFSISSIGKNITVNISQSGAEHFEISSTSASFGATGGVKTFTVTSTGSWNIGTNTNSWGHLRKNGNSLTLRIDANSTSSSRNDYFTIVSGAKSIRVNISQAATSSRITSKFSISSSDANFPASGGSKSFTITSSHSWQIGVSTASWGHLTRNGNTLTLRVDANNNTSTRTDYFTIKSNGKDIRVNVSQAGAAKSSSQYAVIKNIDVVNDVDVDGEKGLGVKVTFNVSNMKGHQGKVNCYFYTSSGEKLYDANNRYNTNENPSQVAVSGTINPAYENTSYSDFEVKIPYSELHLSGTDSRTLQVMVIIWDYTIDSSGKQLIRSSKQSFTCKPTIAYLKVDNSSSNKTKYFDEEGGRERYSIDTSDSNYEIWGLPSWCSIESKTSSGFTLVCKRNSAVSSRNDYFKVKAAGKEIRIDVKQEGASGPSAEIERIWVDHNIFRNYVKGMLIHVRFSIENMKNRQCNVIAAFYYADNTTPMKNPYGGSLEYNQYGNVTYDSARWDDFTIFVPYQGLFISGSGSGTFTFDIIVKDNNGNKLARQNNTSFTYWQ